jgi:Recombinase
MRADNGLQATAAMANQERLRETISGKLDQDYLHQREAAGWRIASIEWVRETSGVSPSGSIREEVPYGMRVGPDCIHLEEDSSEKEAILLMLEMIVQEIRLPQVASELNRRGFRTRAGQDWDAVAVFNLLPRLIEMGPKIFSSEEWVQRRPKVLSV